MRYETFAGTFYPSDKNELSLFIENSLKSAKIEKPVEKAVSFVAPHAGYVYSGKVAAYTYKAIEARNRAKKIDTFVIIGPNHTGYGAPIAVSLQDWHMPFGVVKNDKELARLIVENSNISEFDEGAHAEEHSIEVQLPFLQKVVNEPSCVFICMGDQSVNASEELARAIIKSSEKLGRDVAIIASSDFNHYESAETAKKKDMPAIEALRRLDYIEFNKRLREAEDTACGYGPISVATIFAKEKGAKEGYLLKYANSGDVNNDYSSVVAYASIAFA
ncbi:MAG: MEMO1 family protein [Candidatus Micrarchaeia archaeon]|jgi:AmmeMemoRadiSam system protein B